MTKEQVIVNVKEGRLQEVLAGRGTFFCADHTWQDSHDVVWVLILLSDWVKAIGGAESFSRVLDDTLSRMAVVDKEVALSVLLAYSIISMSDGLSFIIDVHKIIDLLRDNVSDMKSAKMSHGASYEDVIRSINKHESTRRKRTVRRGR